jgi:hypothetical protein
MMYLSGSAAASMVSQLKTGSAGNVGMVVGDPVAVAEGLGVPVFAVPWVPDGGGLVVAVGTETGVWVPMGRTMMLGIIGMVIGGRVVGVLPVFEVSVEVLVAGVVVVAGADDVPVGN